MGFLSVLLPWGILPQVLAVLHFIRRRPDSVWLWIIIFARPRVHHILMEVVPDQADQAVVRGLADASESPRPWCCGISDGNFEELGDLISTRQVRTHASLRQGHYAAHD
jgi:hypothetical protein